MEEKRGKMLEIFFESQDFFLLKELEKKGPQKGVISQSVKDVVQSLLDDDLAFKDKIGTSVYFWSLPSKAGNQLRQMKRKLQEDLQAAKKRRGELETKLDETKKGREESAARNKLLAKLAELQKHNKSLKEELAQHAENDPELLEKKRTATIVARDSANRWTDNTFALQNWCNKMFEHAKDGLIDLYKEVGITEEFDYVD